jgi:predicted dehydrogenase
MKQIKTAVIGLGNNGLAFCERYKKNDKSILAAVCDINEARQRTASEKFDVPGRSFEEILRDPSIELISIHTADNAHKEPFIKAVKGGFNVFVEKPMADKEQDLMEMLQCALSGNKVYAVGHVLRFDPYFSLVKKWVDLGLLGELFYVECDYIHDLRYQATMESWKIEDEIPVLGGGCHAIDLLRWYAGEITEVSSYSNHISYKEMVHDTAMITTLQFASGCVGKVTSLYGVTAPRPPMFNLCLYGTKGTIVRDRISFDGMSEEWMTMPLANDPGHDFMPEIDHVLSCIIEGRPALVTPREGYCASYTGLLAEKSAREKRAMVVEPAPGIFRSQKE